MKKILLIVLLFMLGGSVKAQLEKVVVETFYVSDTLDYKDTTDGRRVKPGSKTYRVYVDMVKGSKIMKIYGNGSHPLKIMSTDTFFNNINRPSAFFGYLINKSWFSGNPTLFLDSWFTLGLATTIHEAVPKPQDTDGTVRSTGTWMGTTSVAGGIIKNNDPAAGIPVTSEDGLLPKSGTYGQWFDNGFKNISGVDTSVFGSVYQGTQFVSYNAFLQQNNGVAGHVPDSNQVLVAQLTTLGNLTFELNIEIKDSAGNNINYVAQSISATTGDTVVGPSLKYPPVCGCTDPQYMEYDPGYACSDPLACVTLKVYGCTDTLACNYDPTANMPLPNFCCYPGYCQDRDIGVVCPGLLPRMLPPAIQSNIYPNPVDDYLTLQLVSGSSDYKDMQYEILDSYNRVVFSKDLGFVPANSYLHVDVSSLPPGLYLLKMTADGSTVVKRFVKN